MMFDLSGLVPFAIVFLVIAALTALASVAVLASSLTTHHRVRVARHQSIPTYYRRLVLAH